MTELEGLLSQAESLLRTKSLADANQTMTQVRDGYESLWAQFNAAENLLQTKEESEKAKQNWLKIKRANQLGSPPAAKTGLEKEKLAITSQKDGDFKQALTHWQASIPEWQQAKRLANVLIILQKQSVKAEKKWQKRQKNYSVESAEAVVANADKKQAKSAQQTGNFIEAKQHWQQAKKQWWLAYSNTQQQVVKIDKQRAEKQRQQAAAQKAKQKRLAEERRQQAAAKKAKQKSQAEERLKVLIAQATPHLVNIPAGSFKMGCVGGKNCRDDEKPVHRVHIKAFAMSQTEVTFNQWDACVNAGGCSHRPSDRGWGRGNRPVINVSWNDIKDEFIPWLNRSTGKKYRLPTEAEWEYAARAGSKKKYSWGNTISCSQARYGNYKGDCGNDQKTVKVKSYSANAFGLYDMHGNVWEWVEDCYYSDYKGAPTNGSIWRGGDCSNRVLRGGSWVSNPSYLRSASRDRYSPSSRFNSYGFRLAQD